MKTLPFALLLASLLFAVPLARADEEDDAADLLRQAGVAEKVERDYVRALELYRQALEKARGSLPEVLWRMARIHEARGQDQEALDTLRRLTRAHGEMLSDERKREVHEAMTRLMPPGTTETTPLGQIHKGAYDAAQAGEVSPLEKKILDMFDRYDRVPRDQRSQVRNDIDKSLRAVGTSALPVLEKIVRDGSPQRAEMAAGLYARIGQADALDGLERLVIEGDAFTERAAIRAFTHLRPGEELSPQVVACVDRLRARNLPEDLDHKLRGVFARHLDGPALLARHLDGGDDRWWYLEYALARRAPGALERAVALVGQGGDEGREALVTLLPYLVPEHSTETGYPMDALGKEGALQAFELLVEPPFDGRAQTATALVNLAKLIESTSGKAAAAQAQAAAWRLFAATEEEHARRELFQHLAQSRFVPSQDLMEDEDFLKRFFLGLYREGASHGRTSLLTTLMERGASFWDAYFRALALLGDREAEGLVWLPQRGLGNELPPKAYDRRWIDLLQERPHLVLAKNRAPLFLIRAAARSGDPRFLDLLRDQTIRRRWVNHDYNWIRALSDYQGPGRLAFVEEALADEHFPANLASGILRALADEDSEASRALLVRIGGDWNHPLARNALSLLDDVRAEDAALEIADRVMRAGDAVPDEYRKQLIRTITYLHLREGVPYLLHEFRAGKHAKMAADAMDDIHAYHERLERFEAFFRGRVEAEAEPSAPQRRVEELLDDEDPAIRRAAVLALGALGRTEALDRIVYLAKEDPDPRVREAALQAVERLAAER